MATTSLELLIRVPVQTRGVPAGRLGSTPKYVLDTRIPHSDPSDPLCRLRRIAGRRIASSLSKDPVAYQSIGVLPNTQGKSRDSRTMCAMRQNIRIK